MIDFTKPVRVIGHGDARVIAVHNTRAFVTWGSGEYAYAFDGETGKADGDYCLTIENIPEPVEPRVTWVWQFGDGSAEVFRSESKAREYPIVDGFNAALLKLTYTPGHASVEIIEERK